MWDKGNNKIMVFQQNSVVPQAQQKLLCALYLSDQEELTLICNI